MIGKLPQNIFWQVYVFRITIAASILFFVLTIIAMQLYPGGTINDAHVHGYSFFFNFFSDLGRAATPNGQSNLPARILFTIALSLGSLGVALFFVAMTQFFPTPSRGQLLSQLSAICSLVTCICFIGVALMPVDLVPSIHYAFLNAALLAFLITFFLFFRAVLITSGFPHEVIWIFSSFALLLATYSLLLLGLLFFGPDHSSTAWEVVQATGQKIIVYASILTALIQSFHMQRLRIERHTGDTTTPLLKTS